MCPVKVSRMAIKRLDMIPDIDAGVLKVTAVPVGVSSGLPITVTAKDAGKTVSFRDINMGPCVSLETSEREREKHYIMPANRG